MSSATRHTATKKSDAKKAERRATPAKITAAAAKRATPTKAAKKSSAKKVAARARRQSGVSTGVLATALEGVPSRAREDFEHAITHPRAGVTMDPDLWGPEPPASKVRAAALETLKRQFITRRAVLDASLTRAEVASMLDVSEQAVTGLLARHELLGIKKGREWRIPAWQLSPESERGFLPALPDLAARFPGSRVALLTWAERPSPDLDDMTPAQALSTGQIEKVLRVAEHLTAAAW